MRGPSPSVLINRSATSCESNRLLNLFKSRDKKPRVRDDLRIYAIGDIHGRVDLLDKILAKIDAHRAGHPCNDVAVVFVGDYVDRGPASRAVLDRLIFCVQANQTVLLKGNHETYLQEFLTNPSVLDNWRQYGGLQTLISYGLKPSLNPSVEEQRELARELASIIPRTHKALLDAMPTSFYSGDFFFAHAGVRPGVPLAAQQEQDLLWIREDFLLCEEDFGKVIVHGHTPVREPGIYRNRINIDTGAYATGHLTCLIIEGDGVDIL
jgi:serine/threonine protein phosphatase 1